MLAGAGGVDHGSLVKLAEEHFKGLGVEYEGQTPEVAPCRFTGESYGDFTATNLFALYVILSTCLKCS